MIEYITGRTTGSAEPSEHPARGRPFGVGPVSSFCPFDLETEPRCVGARAASLLLGFNSAADEISHVKARALSDAKLSQKRALRGLARNV